MGAGKTTVAGLLAGAWGTADTDADIVARTAAPSRTSSWSPARTSSAPSSGPRSPRRSRPTTACSRWAGARCSTPPPALLADHTVVFLRVGLADAVKRVGLGSARPLLLGNVRAGSRRCSTSAPPIYESVATLVVETDGRSAEDVAREIAEALA